MSLKKSAKHLFEGLVRAATEIAIKTGRDRNSQRRDEDIVLGGILSRLDKEIYFPLAYLKLVRECIKKQALNIIEIKKDSNPNIDLAGRYFSSLLDTLSTDIPPLALPIIDAVGGIGDACGRNFAPHHWEKWAGDVSSHFYLSSSAGTKGRLISSVVRWTQSSRCLELGTAYGISAAFILETLKMQNPDGHLTTIEATKKQFLLSSKMLEDRYKNVSCEFGLTQDILPKLAKEGKSFDFMFHDAGHSRKDYVRDFNDALPMLVSGAVVLIDDIRWEPAWSCADAPQCYEGWREVVSHPRVRRAVELDDLGLVLLH